MRLGVVLLAAGRALRFGGNKLTADLGGRPMVCRAMDAIRDLEAEKTAVVVSCEEIAALARTYGYDVIENDAPQLGQAHSIVLGVSAMREMDAVLLLAGDQPLLSSGSLKRLMCRFTEEGRGAACLRDETHRGNPAVFSARYFPELLALCGDRGAKGVLRAHEDDLLVVSCLGADELTDADTPQALEEIRKRIK